MAYQLLLGTTGLTAATTHLPAAHDYLTLLRTGLLPTAEVDARQLGLARHLYQLWCAASSPSTTETHAVLTLVLAGCDEQQAAPRDELRAMAFWLGDALTARAQHKLLIRTLGARPALEWLKLKRPSRTETPPLLAVLRHAQYEGMGCLWVLPALGYAPLPTSRVNRECVWPTYQTDRGTYTWLALWDDKDSPPRWYTLCLELTDEDGHVCRVDADTHAPEQRVRVRFVGVGDNPPTQHVDVPAARVAAGQLTEEELDRLTRNLMLLARR